jgi:hypothetical protein
MVIHAAPFACLHKELLSFHLHDRQAVAQVSPAPSSSLTLDHLGAKSPLAAEHGVDTRLRARARS